MKYVFLNNLKFFVENEYVLEVYDIVNKTSLKFNLLNDILYYFYEDKGSLFHSKIEDNTKELLYKIRYDSLNKIIYNN